jgi:hypothetical protein
MLITLCNGTLREEVFEHLKKVLCMTAWVIDSISPTITFVLMIAGVMASFSLDQGSHRFQVGGQTRASAGR